jgi:hypothetical protein
MASNDMLDQRLHIDFSLWSTRAIVVGMFSNVPFYMGAHKHSFSLIYAIFLKLKDDVRATRMNCAIVDIYHMSSILVLISYIKVTWIAAKWNILVVNSMFSEIIHRI